MSQHCLCLLDLALQKQALFMDLLRESQASLLVSPLEQLLQGVSAHTRKADHITSIARYTQAQAHAHAHAHARTHTHTCTHKHTHMHTHTCTHTHTHKHK